MLKNNQNGITNILRNYQNAKTALNLSRGVPSKYASSNRIASLIANGIMTFIDKKTKYQDFFNNDEMGFLH